MIEKAMKALESLGIRSHRITRTVSIPQLIRDDGHAYLVRVMHRRTSYFNKKLWDALIGKPGDIIFFNSRGNLVGFYPFNLLPMTGGKIDVSGTPLQIIVGLKQDMTTVALDKAARTDNDEIRGYIEGILKGDFHSLGEFMTQCILTTGASMGYPSVLVTRWSQYDYVAKCVNCHKDNMLMDDRRHARLAWMVSCSCGKRFIGMKNLNIMKPGDFP